MNTAARVAGHIAAAFLVTCAAIAFGTARMIRDAYR